LTEPIAAIEERQDLPSLTVVHEAALELRRDRTTKAASFVARVSSTALASSSRLRKKSSHADVSIRIIAGSV
jgi:hypothetical protein